MSVSEPWSEHSSGVRPVAYVCVLRVSMAGHSAARFGHRARLTRHATPRPPRLSVRYGTHTDRHATRTAGGGAVSATVRGAVHCWLRLLAALGRDTYSYT
jgi:hypothetical protein